jgi:hypothetical protein
MGRCIFESPTHANGGCIFDDPGEIIGIVTCDRVVFDNPAHANGCIFDDPCVFVEPVTGGGGDTGYEHLLREDEEILAVIVAYMAKKCA